MDIWRYVLLPFHRRIKVINIFLIHYITFYSPILCLSQRSSKTFLQPIKDFMWWNKVGQGRAWHGGKWSKIASPRALGGLGIINPEKHVVALCAKLFKALASSNQSWAIMSREMITHSNLRSSGTEWKRVSVENKLVRPKGTWLKLGGNMGQLISKCLKAAECLRWNEVPRYFRNSSLNWSPWGNLLEPKKANPLWLETV